MLSQILSGRIQNIFKKSRLTNMGLTFQLIDLLQLAATTISRIYKQGFSIICNVKQIWPIYLIMESDDGMIGFKII